LGFFVGLFFEGTISGVESDKDFAFFFVEVFLFVFLQNDVPKNLFRSFFMFFPF
jgi:hypothetical protein